MKNSNHAHRECLEDASGAKYFFGRYGYIDIVDGVAVAHITEKKAFLADSGFTDKVALLLGEPQELVVSAPGLKGMLEHLEVSPYSENQKKSAQYRRFTTKNTPPQNAVITG